MLASLGQKLLSYALDWAFKKLIWYVKKETIVKKNNAEINKQRDRLKKAIDAAYDGTPLTDEEKKELIDSARELARDY